MTDGAVAIRDTAFADLAAAHDPDGRSGVFAELRRAAGPLLLGGDADRHALLTGVIAPRAKLRRADLGFADMRGADLSHAFLPQAILQHATLERACLAHADLSHADCRDASMGEADLTGALLEDADLSGTSLRFATLTGATLEGARLCGADLWGVRFDDADLSGADLRDTVLREASAQRACFADADLQRARLMNVTCAQADFAGADLREATIRNVDLTGSNLSRANLAGVDLTACTLTGVRWHRAQLRRTTFSRDQLGPAVGEERVGEHEAAAGAYATLERNFVELGDVDAASWAYRRKRRMEKHARLDRARGAVGRGEWPRAAGAFLDYLGSLVVEWTCDYGESVGRVFGSIAFVFVFFLLLYGITGSVVRLDGTRHVPTTRLIDLALFSLGTMTSNVASSGTLIPSHSYTTFLAGAQATLSLFLMGLLGFVAGNRIRR